jgi:hypothetical protein
VSGDETYRSPVRCATACSQDPCGHDWSEWERPVCPEDGARGTLATAEGDVLVYVCDKGHDWTEPVRS